MAEVDLRIRHLKEHDIAPIADAFATIGWNKPGSQYRLYLSEQERGERKVLVAFLDGEFAGYLTVRWVSGYEPFASQGIPEVQDLNVLPRFRRRGIATRLMNDAERLVARRSSVAGIGVGMTSDYGAAQRMYVRRGYVPDGNGLVSVNDPVKHGERVLVDDDLILYFTKDLESSNAAV